MNYLDNAATTLVKPRAVGGSGASCAHRRRRVREGRLCGGAARRRPPWHDCREQAAALFGLYDPSRVVFTRTPRTRSTSPSMRSQDRG